MREFKFDDIAIYAILLGVISLILFILSPYLGIVAIAASVWAVYTLYKTIVKFYDEAKRSISKVKLDLDSVAKHAVFNMPFPQVVLGEEGNIIWYNTDFIHLFDDEDISNKSIGDLLSIDMREVHSSGNKSKIDVLHRGVNYNVFINIVNRKTTADIEEKLVMLYFVDDLGRQKLVEKYKGDKALVLKIEVDNFSDALDSTEGKLRPILIAEIDSTIKDYFANYNALVCKTSDDSYVVVLNYSALEQIKEKRFDLLDDVRDLDLGNSLPITLSIGVSSYGLALSEGDEDADTALDIALARGGDQAVVRVAENYEFFGGKSKAVEKRNKVKARVLGTALRQLIDSSKDVYIMGHKNADMDAIGSAIGVLRAVTNRGKEGYIVLEHSNPSIDNLMVRMEAEEPDMYAKVIGHDFALSNIDPGSLLILVDNHKPSFTECPELIEKTTQIVVIDHHRRGKEFVENPVLNYIEPYASSTSELVTEMLTYMNDDLNLSHFEADALMSGIVVDTKNFSFQTGVRTFEAASVLRRAGSDMLKVKALFQDDYDTIRSKAEVLNRAEMYREIFAISTMERDSANSILVAAQAADELLDINGIKASFVLVKVGDRIHISGRSRGDISVQLILEKLGGGGHLSMAGAQVDHQTMEEAVENIKIVIDEYMKEESEE